MEDYTYKNTNYAGDLPINLYDPRCAGAESYRQLAQEVISNDIETEMNVISDN